MSRARIVCAGVLLWLLLAGNGYAITLFKSTELALYTLPAEQGADNSQPVNFVDVDSLAQLLASVQLRSDEAGGVIYLMAEDQAIDAAKELAKALSRVDRERDILLVSYRNIGSFPSIKRLATALRVFVSDGELNLIFGQIDTFLDEFREPRQKASQPGSRLQSMISGGSVIAADWFALAAGRDDWVRYPLRTDNSPRIGIRRETPAPATVSATAASPPSAVAAPAPAAPTSASEPVTEQRWRDLETGLETLERLHQKHLISDQELSEKRKALFDALGL